MGQFDNVSIVKQANVYFDGKCISHTVLFPDGSRKTLGVILPSALHFQTGVPEIMEILTGGCRVQLAGQTEWQSYQAGDSFSVPGNSGFRIEVNDTLHYVCHFG
ncbi:MULTISPECIES: pyrimidine/purine nucleoside phosphorylase [Methylococcus]|uniref:Pyrimidine/purine nucleoside phosphorylase n=1 Tax=Methylococcus capsulatus TaxID=414 RepID=A0ABZ2F429_METCP|nr:MULTISPECIES: pyrimidine/purine nucleoside phosphorylase [Methylococcus]MDF9393318.1 pyrimidine/purine nucleoside phosphorylase [Methylococcus capsulatus]